MQGNETDQTKDDPMPTLHDYNLIAASATAPLYEVLAIPADIAEDIDAANWTIGCGLKDTTARRELFRVKRAAFEASVAVQAVTLRNVKPGEFVRRKADAKKTYVKGAYDKASKAFSLTDFDDINREIFVKASATVYVGFDF